MQNAAAVLEQAWVQYTRQNNIADDEQRYTIDHAPGSLVLLHRPITRKEQTTRLLYQTVGPFEVTGKLPNQDPSKCNAYYLKNIGTGKVTPHNVRDILPYISSEAYAAKTDDDAHQGAHTAPPAMNPGVDDSFDPQAGDWLLLPNFGGVKYHLLKVVERLGDRVKAWYYNTPNSKRLTLFCSVYSHASKPEIQSNRKPTQKGYSPHVDTIPIADFNQTTYSHKHISSTKAGYKLNRKEVDRVLSYPPLTASM